MFVDPFPDDVVTSQYARSILITVARNLGETDIKERLKKDTIYARVLGTVVRLSFLSYVISLTLIL